MTPDEKLRHWEDTFRGMRLYPFFIHDPYAILQIAHPGDERALAQSIWQLGEQLKGYAVQLMEEAGGLQRAMAPANPAFPPQAPEHAQPALPFAPAPAAPQPAVPVAQAPQFPPAMRRGRGDLPPGVQEVQGAPPTFSFMDKAGGGKPSVA